MVTLATVLGYITAAQDLIANITKVVEAAKANGDLYISTKNIAVEAAKGGAQVAAQLGAAAMNAVSFHNSSSWSSSLSASLAGSVSNSYSGINSVSQTASV